MKKVFMIFAFCIILAGCTDSSNIPIITLNGQDHITLELGSEYSELNAIGLLNDEETDVIITGTIDVNVVGDYQIKYNAMSDSNRSAIEVIRTVSIVDTTAPTIAFLELDNFTYEIGTPFSYNHIVKTDNYNNESDISITMIGSIDVDTLGSYELSFQAADSSGNESNIITETFVVEEKEELDYFNRYMKDNTYLYDPNPFSASYLYDELEKVYRGLLQDNGEYELVYFFFLHNVYEEGGMLEKIEFVCPVSENHVYELEDSQIDYVFKMPIECVENNSISIITYAHDDFVSSTRSWDVKFFFSLSNNLSVDTILNLDYKFGNSR